MKSVIVLHHTGIVTTNDQFGPVNEYHKRRGFPQTGLGYYGGYDSLVERSGKEKRYRKRGERGAHTNAYYKGKHLNDTAFGICFAGSLDKMPIAKEQIQSLVKIVSDLQKEYGIKDIDLLNHFDTKPTACPGIDLVSLYKAHRGSETPLESLQKTSGYDMARSKLRSLRRAKNRASDKVRKMIQRQIDRLLRRL